MKQNQTEMLWIGLKIATKNTEKQTRKSRQANNEAQQTREQQPTINSNVSEEKEMNIWREKIETGKKNANSSTKKKPTHT